VAQAETMLEDAQRQSRRVPESSVVSREPSALLRAGEVSVSLRDNHS